MLCFSVKIHPIWYILQGEYYIVLLGSICGALAGLDCGAMVGLDCGAEYETMAHGAVKRWWSPWRIMCPLCSEWRWRLPGWSWWPPPQSRSSQEIRRQLWSRNSVVRTASMTLGTVTLWTVSIGVTLCRLGSQMGTMTVAWGKKGSWMAFVAVT